MHLSKSLPFYIGLLVLLWLLLLCRCCLHILRFLLVVYFQIDIFFQSGLSFYPIIFVFYQIVSVVSRSLSVTSLLQRCVLILAADIWWQWPPLALHWQDPLDHYVVRRRTVRREPMAIPGRWLAWDSYDSWPHSCSPGISKEHLNHIWNAIVLAPLTTTVGMYLVMFRSWPGGVQFYISLLANTVTGWGATAGKGLKALVRNCPLGLLSCTVANSVTLGKFFVVPRMTESICGQ